MKPVYLVNSVSKCWEVLRAAAVHCNLCISDPRVAEVFVYGLIL